MTPEGPSFQFISDCVFPKTSAPLSFFCKRQMTT